MRVALLAYLDNNLGDDLMIKIIAEKYPNVNFNIYSENSVVKNTFSKHVNISVRSMSDMKVDLPLIDVVISLGGSIFIIKNFKEVIFRLLKINFLIKAKIHGARILTVGCNLGPFNRFGKIIAKLEIFLNDIVIVRDNEYRNIYKRWLASGKVVESSDFVYSCKFPKLSKSHHKILGISAYRSIKNPKLNYVNYQALAKISNDYIKNGGQVKIFAFDSEGENDLSAAHHIFNMIENQSKASIVPYLGDIDKFIRQFSVCSFHICIRFHSAVLSDILGIPFYPIAYSNKTFNLIKDRYPNFALKNIEKLKLGSEILEDICKSINGEVLACADNELPNVDSDYFGNMDKFFAVKNCF